MSGISQVLQEIKEQMKQDYLDGISVPEIAKKYNFKYERTVYYHLKPLSKEDKLQHLRSKMDNHEEENDMQNTQN